MRQRNFWPLLLLLSLLTLYPLSQLQAQGPSTQKPQQEKSSVGFQASARKEAPFGLTAADGTGLALVNLKAQAVLEGPLAFTELQLTFENSQDRILEGRFQITLPDGAAISRFAMKIDDRWQEAEVVERQAARVAYEDFLHRRQDPALLENEAGNEFSARIFPIPAKGRKELILSYSQELGDSHAPYLLPLQGLPRIGELDLEVRVATSGQNTLSPEIQAVRRQDYLPEGDFVVSQNRQPSALRAGNLLVARVRAQTEVSESEPLQNLLILVDTSASRALGHAEQSEMVSQILSGLPELDKVTVAAFDQEVKEIYSGPSQGFSVKSLLNRQALGATDLRAALRWAVGQPGFTRMLLVTDGISTAGPEDLKGAFQGTSLQRLDVLLVGGIRDPERMRALVRDNLKEEGLVLDGQLDPREVAKQLQLGVTSGVDVAVDGAEWVWPSTLDNLRSGEERLVYAQLKGSEGAVSLSLAGQPYALEVRPSAFVPLLQRQAMVARIARLESDWKESTEPKQRSGLAQQIVHLSTAHRVLSDKTALLVLETEADYERFGIDRKALSDILTVGPQGLRLTQRQEVALVASKPEPRDEVQSKGAEAPSKASSGNSSFTPGSSNDDGVVEDSGRIVNPRSETPVLSVEPVATAPANAAPGEPQPTEAPRQERHEADSANSLVAQERRQDREAPSEHAVDPKNAALSGPTAEIQQLLKAKQVERALVKARQWQQSEPGNVLALVALGDCLEAKGLPAEAARVYGSIIDLFPSRADLRRFAGSRLQALGQYGLPLAVDSFEKAVEQRPDHVSSHRFLALALARQKKFESAFNALEKGLTQRYPGGRFLSYERILGDDLGIIGAAWAAQAPKQRSMIIERLAKLGCQLASQPSLRFVLTWETDANDVDFHIHDAKDGHAYYSQPKLASGGELYGDVTTGYGPECFAIPGKPQAFPYRLQIHYYSRGPMGYGMGQLEILQHDGQGHLSFEERPYVVMQDGAYVDLGMVEGPL